jgi:predicted flap endonuclease-1-like 5' DNA nuclease
MPDGSDPGRVEHYTDRQVERVRRTVREPNRSDILQTIRRGRRGNVPSPKPNQRTKPAWSTATIRNNARTLRILAGVLQGLDEAEYEGTTWRGREGRADYPDRLLALSPARVTDLIAELAVERDWARSNERDYCLTVRNHLLAHDEVDAATAIDYPQVGQENAAVDVETVPTRADLLALVDGESVRDRAMYTVLWESGCRVTALAALKVKHWTPKGDGYGIIQDLPSDGHLPESERAAVRSYLTSNYVQERNVTRVLDAVERSPLRSLGEDDLTIKSLPSIPDSLEPGTTATSAQTANTDSPESTTTQPTPEEPGDEGETDPAVFEDIPGIGPKRSRQLAQTGHSSLAGLAEARPTDLAATSEISEGIAAVAIEGARALVGKVPPAEERLAAQTGVSARTFDKALSSLAAAGVPPSEAEPSLRTIYGPTVGDIEAVSGAQAYFLWEAGYRTPRDIVEASRQELEAVYDVGSATAPQIQDAARELLDSFG